MLKLGRYPLKNIQSSHLKGSTFETDDAKDLFTDTAAILNLLELRGIMGCPVDTRSVFTGAFQAKKRTSTYFSLEKSEHDDIQQCTTIFFAHYNLFLGKLEEKLELNS